MLQNKGPELGTASVGHEVQIPDAIAMIQTRLGVDELQARDLASIQIVCPAPPKLGEAREMSLGDFMSDPHGAGKAEQILNIAVSARERGATAEEAFVQALGFTAVRDEVTGGLARMPKPEPESKKK